MANTETPVSRPKIGATGKYDGEWVDVVRHTANATIFRYMGGGQREFPIYDADWDELSPRLTLFPASVYGSRYAHLYD